jgi:hypothetical protein
MPNAEFNTIELLIKQSNLEDSPRPPTCDEDDTLDIGDFTLNLHDSKIPQQAVAMSHTSGKTPNMNFM